MVRTFAKTLCLAGLIGSVGLGAAGAKAQMPPPPPDGPLFTPAQMREGTTLTERQCAFYRSTVFVTAQGVGLCFRYYLSTAGGSSTEAVYFLDGDTPDDQLAYDPAKIDQKALSMSKRYQRPAIYLARMGVDGSSGNQRFRRTWLEVEATHKAINAINARHGFRIIHVMGQSGGAHLTGALVGIRQDIGCAVPGSGRLAFDAEYRARQARRPAHLRHYSPDDALPQVVVQSRKTRILVVTDQNDKRVPAHTQTGFVQSVRQAGGTIGQFWIVATDELSHGATAFTRLVMAGCLERQSDYHIGVQVDRLSSTLWAKRMQQPSAAAPAPALPRTGPPQRQALGPQTLGPSGNPR